MNEKQSNHWAIGMLAGCAISSATILYVFGMPSPNAQAQVEQSQQLAPTCHAASAVRVVDGDTIVADLALSFELTWRKQRVRIARIDTPERNGEGFQVATDQTSDFVDGCSELVVCTKKRGKFGRLIGEVWCGGRNLSDEHLESGTAHYGNKR